MIGRLHDLIAVNRAIVGSLDYEEVLQLIVEKTASFVHADACILLLADTGDVARIVAARGIDERRARGFAVAFDEKVGESLIPLLDFREHDFFMAVPVMARQRVRGALVVFRRGPQRPDTEEDILVRALADAAAIALEHASRFREVRQLSQQKSQLLEAIQSNTTSYLAYLDCDLRFLEANAAYCGALGMSAAEVVGHTYSEINPGAETTRKLLERTCQTGTPTELQEAALSIYREGSPAQTVYWDWSARPVVGEFGDVQGVVISAVDVTQKVLTRRELEVANHRKDEFLAMLAHELRNPLSAISTAVEVLRICGAEQPRAVQSIDAATRQVAHMRRLLDDLLDVSRITSGRIELRRDPIDVGPVIAQAVQLSAPLIQSRRQELAIELAPGPLGVYGDADRLVQVVSNLLTNAAKYTHPGGHIWLTAQPRDGDICVSVRDDGVGLSAEAMPHIFELFVQANRALDRTQGGLGIGLTIAQRLVEMHGGRIEAHSEGRGCGSEFLIRLPMCGALQPETGTDVRSNLNAPRGRTILLAEDNADAAEMLTSMLELEGHNVTVVDNGIAAVDAAVRERPEVLLLDIGLPHLSGYDVARQLRTKMKRNAPLIIALTGYGRAEDRQRAVEAGIDHHLVKPIEPDQLRQLLAN